MPSRAFYCILFTAFSLCALFNVAIARLSRNTIPRQIAKRIDQAPTLNCLALGNSLMQAGFDEQAFGAVRSRPERQITAINAGLGSSTPVEHLLLARRAYRNHRTVDCLYYGFFDFQLTQLPHTVPGDLIGNRAMLYYFEPSIVPRYFNWTLSERLAFHSMRLFPALEERGAIWEKVEILRRKMAQAGLPAERTNRFGNVNDFALLEADSQAAFEKECEMQIANRQDLAAPVADLIRLARERGSRVAMVEMPMHPSHQQRFYQTSAWKRYREYLKTLLRTEGAAYVEAGDWLQDESSFLDHLHASPQGAALFSRRLAESATP